MAEVGFLPSAPGLPTPRLSGLYIASQEPEDSGLL